MYNKVTNYFGFAVLALFAKLLFCFVLAMVKWFRRYSAKGV